MEVREPSAKYFAAPRKQTEVGSIPVDWGVAQIGGLISDMRGGAPLKPSDFTDGGVKVLPKGAVGRTGWLQIREWDLQFCSPTYAAGHIRNQVDRGYTIVVLRDLVPSGPSIGLIVRIRVDETFLLAQGVYGFRASDRVLPGYLVHLSNSSWYRKLANSIMVGSTQVHITNTAFRKARIPLPPTQEQEAISNALDDADALIDSLEQLLTKKRQIKQGAMQELFNPTRLIARSVYLEQISGFITKGATPTTYGFGWESGGIVFLRSECVSTNGLDLTQSMYISEKAHTTLRRSAVVVGDLLMTITGNVGRVAIATIDCNINQHIARIRITDPEVNPDFIYHQLARREVREELESITTGQAYPQLSLRQVRERTVQVPSRAEQDRIAQVLSDMDAEITTLESRLTKARALKQAMAQALLTGKIRLI